MYPARIFQYDEGEFEGEIAFTRAKMGAHPLPMWYAHGTNALALRGMLETDCTALSPSKLRERGVDIATGENLGTGNDNYIATVRLASDCRETSFFPDTFLTALNYAYNSQQCLRPSNIAASIKINRASIEEEKYFPGSPLSRAQMATKKAMPHLEKMAGIFEKMSPEDKAEWERLCSIPVVVIGQSDSPVIRASRTDIKAEAFLEYLPIGVVASEPTYLPALRELHHQSERARGLSFVPFGCLEGLQRNYVQVMNSRKFKVS